MAPPSNPTGFSMKTFTDAATSTQWRAKDPWKRNEAWRYTGPFTRGNRMKGAFPGFGIAVVAFTGYVIVEQLFFAKDHHASEHDESAGHHKAL
ncbi:hypothetical protein A1O7_03359 [Cladophialophora yegresii CBS 114405]|uniref:NADH dehydrogenase (Ubiquinone) 1 beta subcomplex 3 n=1 Tax=Cladophialophora yegresii CBS 114405 TaxID=1182544 RepID=W9WEC6_9EURO|nr:uncharacterized protein A1O7_03359 [Cladophialophora yegresii CBS 114405]EXJ62916.1 hypothetical protein A1O7_03359 [Cladophialophora yegresii CBS 114405]